MGITTLWQFWLIGIPTVIFGCYVLLWAIPGILMLSVVALGSIKHIIFIDKQLAKNLDKYYDEKGYMRPNYQMSYSIGNRFINYCLAYPFIQKRISTNSVKFKFFMWINSLGYWSFCCAGFFVLLAKVIGILP